LTENISPVPPAPQVPEQAPQYQQTQYPSQQPPEDYGKPALQPPVQAPQPQYSAPYGYPGAQQAYGQPQGGYPTQGYPAPGPYAQPQQGTYYQQPGQWAPPGPLKSRSSGYRVASGIIGIVLGTWLLIPSVAGFGAGSSTAFMAFLILVAALGNVTAGIVLLANQRSRNQGSPITSLSFAGLALLLGLIGLAVTYFGAALFVSSLLLATPVLIVMGIGISREKRGL
jgi:hypothetical protein